MPRFVIVQNTSRGLDRPPRVLLCDTFMLRLRGLMFRSRLGPDEGLLLTMPRASRMDAAIHMFFVPFQLAVFWISTAMQVVDKTLAEPWHPAYIPRQAARFVLEVHPDLLAAYEIGHTVTLLDA